MAWCVAALAPAWAGMDQPPSETTALTGQAISTDGKPVVGVKLTFQYARPGEGARVWTATSDEKGEFRVEVSREAARWVQISADPPPGAKLAPMAISSLGRTAALDSTGPPPPITVLLAPATACVRGAVLGESNEPVAGATVTIASGDYNRGIVRTATADTAGKYEIPALAPGMYTVRSVDPPAGLPWVRLSTWKPSGVRSIGLGDGVTREESFRLPRGARISGRVLTEGGKPVAGAAVSCGLDAATEEGKPSVYQLAGQWYSGQAVSDDTGRYVLGGLTQETYSVTVRGPAGSDLAPAALRGINAPKDADVTVQDVTLQKGGSLIVLVLGQDRKPLAGATAAMRTDRDSFRSPVTLTCNAQGRATFSGLATGRYEVTVQPPAGSVLCRRTLKDLPAVAGLVLEQAVSLGEGANVSGKAIDPAGKPVAGAKVWLRHGYESFGNTATDGEGKFLIAGVSPSGRGGADKWSLSVSPPDSCPELLSAAVDVKEPATQPAAAMEVRLQTGAVIVGLVSGPDGKGLAGCRVLRAQGTRGGVSTHDSVRTDSGGRYVLAHVDPGRWTILVGPPEDTGLLPAEAPAKQLAAGDKATVNVTLKGGAAIAGKAAVSSGKPAPVCQIVLRLTSASQGLTWALNPNNQITAFTGPDGGFRLKGVPPGAHKLECLPLDPRYRAEAMDVTVSATAEQPVQVPVLLTGSVAGEVRTAAGKPVGGEMLRVNLQDAARKDRSLWATVDERGRFDLPFVLPGKYSLNVQLNKKATDDGMQAPSPVELTVAEGNQTKISVTVQSR